MTGTYGFTDIACGRCKDLLVWVAKPESYKLAICPSCFCSGDYHEVIEEGAGLDDGQFFTEEDKQTVREIGARRDRG